MIYKYGLMKNKNTISDKMIVCANLLRYLYLTNSVNTVPYLSIVVALPYRLLVGKNSTKEWYGGAMI